MAPPNMTVTFLGTTSGGGPTETRNCSSLVLDVLGNGSLWMVDCAEGTVRQFAQQPYHDHRRLRMGKITKVFVTHMHADHTMGLITLLRNVLGIPKPAPAPAPSPSSLHPSTNASPHPPTSSRVHRTPRIEIYGPAGLRAFVRTVFALTHTRCDEHYAVHELLLPGEAASASAACEAASSSAACEPVDSPHANANGEVLHANEEAGRDIAADADGFWRDILVGSEQRIVGSEQRMGSGSGGGRVTVDAGPIVHRDPCLGFVFREHEHEHEHEHAPDNMPRTLVILGDTSDASALIPLVRTVSPLVRTVSPLVRTVTLSAVPTPVSLVVHEATDACMPRHIDKYATTGSRTRTDAGVQARAVEKGHSTPGMAGAFARAVAAERLVLNHIGARFPAPPPPPHRVRSAGDRFRVACVREIERQATHAWGPRHGGSAVAAWDFYTVTVPPNAPAPRRDAAGDAGRSGAAADVAMKDSDSDAARDGDADMDGDMDGDGDAGASGVGHGGWSGAGAGGEDAYGGHDHQSRRGHGSHDRRGGHGSHSGKHARPADDRRDRSYGGQSSGKRPRT